MARCFCSVPCSCCVSPVVGSFGRVAGSSLGVSSGANNRTITCACVHLVLPVYLVCRPLTEASYCPVFKQVHHLGDILVFWPPCTASHRPAGNARELQIGHVPAECAYFAAQKPAVRNLWLSAFFLMFPSGGHAAVWWLCPQYHAPKAEQAGPCSPIAPSDPAACLPQNSGPSRP